MDPLEPFAHTSGPKDARVVLVGEAFGEQEERIGLPFVGTSGQELTRMLGEAGIDRFQCLLTNVFPLRPPDNNIEALCGKKADCGPGYFHSAFRQGKYFLPKYLQHLQRLRTELSAAPRNLVVALGNTACWALLGSSGIGGLRGSTAYSTLVPGVKILPTYHPAGVLRNWAWRPIVLADFQKAKREAESPLIVRPEREILIEPTLDELVEWFNRPAELYACDVETSRRQITMIGFARSARDAVVVPFLDWTKPEHSYWPTAEAELTARYLCGKATGGPVPKLFQNGLYDLQYMWREGFPLRNCLHDTMLLSHSLWPEMQKGLGFLGSIHTDEGSWKRLRKQEDTKRNA